MGLVIPFLDLVCIGWEFRDGIGKGTGGLMGRGGSDTKAGEVWDIGLCGEEDVLEVDKDIGWEEETRAGWEVGDREGSVEDG